MTWRPSKSSTSCWPITRTQARSNAPRPEAARPISKSRWWTCACWVWTRPRLTPTALTPRPAKSISPAPATAGPRTG